MFGRKQAKLKREFAELRDTLGVDVTGLKRLAEIEERERKATDQALASAIDTLEARVADATALLAQVADLARATSADLTARVVNLRSDVDALTPKAAAPTLADVLPVGVRELLGGATDPSAAPPETPQDAAQRATAAIALIVRGEPTPAAETPALEPAK